MSEYRVGDCVTARIMGGSVPAKIEAVRRVYKDEYRLSFSMHSVPDLNAKEYEYLRSMQDDFWSYATTLEARDSEASR